MRLFHHHSSFVIPSGNTCATWPDPWQMVLVALGALILCSCRSPGGGRVAPEGQVGNLPHAQAGGEMLPAEAYTGAAAQWHKYPTCPNDCPDGPAACPTGCPAAGPWSPPGIRQPWPQDEYLCDGGDQGKPVGINAKKEILGLKMEDTVAHFDTLDGRTVVEPSNEVCLYSPRFGAVRQVVSLRADEERQQLGGVHNPQKLDIPTTLQVPAGAKQNLQAGDQIAARPPVAMRSKQGDGVMSGAVGPRGFQNAFKAYENLALIRLGMFEESEMPLLARGANAAIAWSHVQAVEVILDKKGAMAEVKYDPAAAVYTVDTPPGNPRLRLCKLASTASAKPGEEVDFTIRFDNVGDEPIGNVTILDSLSTRLEYIPNSAQCNVEAKFSTRLNEGESAVVRCEVAKPLDPGQGGILRFRCRVR
jgi:uncharacterized repeat protein (TIGR01451 family)